MAGRLRRPSFLAALLLFAAGSTSWAGDSERVEIIDGDSLRVGGTLYALTGIDAPELGQTCQIKSRSYDCGMVARTALLDLTAGSAVTCGPVEGATASTANQAEEGVPAVCRAAGYDLSEGMAYTGWALARRDVASPYRRLEERAEAKGHGLWRGEFIAPWEWRERTGRMTPASDQ